MKQKKKKKHQHQLTVIEEEQEQSVDSSLDSYKVKDIFKTKENKYHDRKKGGITLMKNFDDVIARKNTLSSPKTPISETQRTFRKISL